MRPEDERAAREAARAARDEGWKRDDFPLSQGDIDAAEQQARAEMLREERMERMRNAAWRRNATATASVRERVSGYGMSLWRARFMGSDHIEFDDGFDEAFD